MIHQIHINDSYKWFPSIDCDTSREPSFLSLANIYVSYADISPNTIRQDNLENLLKLTDANIEVDDSSVMFYQYFNLEKAYAYMLKNLLKRL